MALHYQLIINYIWKSSSPKTLENSKKINRVEFKGKNRNSICYKMICKKELSLGI